LKACDSERENALSEVHRIEQEISLIEHDIFAQFNAQVGVKSVQQFEESRIRFAQEASKKRVEFNVLISRLRNELDTEKQRDLKKPLKYLREKIESETKRMKKLQKSIELNKNAMTKLQSELNSSEESHKKVIQDIEIQQELLKKFEAKTTDFTSKIRTIRLLLYFFAKYFRCS
jgi:chromosome segregation ATPase